MSAKLIIAISAGLGIGITFAIVKFDTINIFVGPQYHQSEVLIPTTTKQVEGVENKSEANDQDIYVPGFSNSIKLEDEQPTIEKHYPDGSVIIENFK